MSESIRILLIDDHTLFRESLIRLLETEPGLQVVGDCATVAGGREFLTTHEADVVLLDYDLGDEIGTNLLGEVAEDDLGAKVMIVTAGMTAGATLNAANAGVTGIVLKHSDPRKLVEAIHRVAAGETWWDPGILKAEPADSAAEPEAASGAKTITERQRQVLRNILDGLTNKEIAARLHTSESAVKATIQELFNKAGVRTRSQLVRVAIERYPREWLRESNARA